VSEPPEDLYRRLQRHLDSMPIPFPATRSGVELRFLRRLFDPDEARIALALSVLPEPAEKIHRRLGGAVPLAELRRRLQGLILKGAINGGAARWRGKTVPGYGKAPLVIGMFEFQVNRLTRGVVEDFHAYMDEGFREALLAQKTSQLRTVPINTEVASEGTIGRYDDIRGRVQGSRGPFGVMNCVCREAQGLIGHSCRTTDDHETCLSIGGTAVWLHKVGRARLVSKEQFLGVLDRAERLGMVLQPQNSREPAFICCCCPDCCEVLSNARKLPRPAEYFQPNYQAQVDGQRCTGCRTCLGRCPMEALTVIDKRARVNLERCIGCGLCVTTCKQEAIRLKPRRRQRVPPRSMQEMYGRIMLERYGPLRTLGKAARLLLGLKL
jgi:electron transport complex protein RnfB